MNGQWQGKRSDKFKDSSPSNPSGDLSVECTKLIIISSYVSLEIKIKFQENSCDHESRNIFHISLEEKINGSPRIPMEYILKDFYRFE